MAAWIRRRVSVSALYSIYDPHRVTSAEIDAIKEMVTVVLSATTRSE